jgi:hypothetical protein
MSPASSDALMLAVADPAPLRPTLVAVNSCTRQHANLLVPGQIASGLVLVFFKKMFGFVRHGIFLQRHGLKSVDLFSWLCFPNPAGFLVRQVPTVHLSHHIGCSDAKLEY